MTPRGENRTLGAMRPKSFFCVPISVARLLAGAALSLLCLSRVAVPAFAGGFVHPGALDSREELDFVRAKIREGQQPWKGEFERLRSSPLAVRAPHGLATINSAGPDAAVSRDDAIAAYTQALLWTYSGDAAYAERATAILDAWAQLERFVAGTEQDRLQAGWIGSVFAPAAEIMRGYPGWPPARVGAFQSMFRRAFYPQLNTASFWNGNVDLTEIDAMMSIAVFNDDRSEFREGLQRLSARLPAYIYLSSDGPRPRPIRGDSGDFRKFWYNPVKWVDGLTQETCRDNGHHAQYGLGSALHAAEVAWHQGIDVYSENRVRLTAAMELMARQFLTGSMLGVAPNDSPTPDRYDTWEVGYAHYHDRVGLELPETRRLIVEQIRPRSERATWNLDYETLTHGDLSREAPPSPGGPAGAPSAEKH